MRRRDLAIGLPYADFVGVDAAVDALFDYCNNPDYSVSEMVKQNVENAVRIHATTGGSTNLMMHMVSAVIHTGVDFSIWDYERIRMAKPIPDLFDYSLTQGRTIFELAEQCCSGQIRGMETVMYELIRNGVSMNVDAPRYVHWVRCASGVTITRQRPDAGPDEAGATSKWTPSERRSCV